TAIRAFNLAERYQIPVVILTDEYLANSYQTVKKFDLSQVKIDRGQLISDEEASRLNGYKRHQFTESGISPRLMPMRGKALVVTDSDEHDETGHTIDDAVMRNRMMLKRLKKSGGLSGEFAKPRLYMKPDAEMTLVGWGSSFGAINEAAQMVEKEGLRVNVMQFNEIWPFPAQAVTSALSSTKRNVVIENNATGQLRRLIRAETGILASGGILKFDGRPFSPRQIATQLRKEAA
ncbi:MAG: hypothetical protein HW414_1309, partial [Dehalococcoidia bacterium]|nr:hypothetical protein [Dehalococcoidia bacterium]